MSVPLITVNGTSTKGDFSIHFRSAPEVQQFRRFGCLPDNEVLGNKLINILGRNSLNLLKNAKDSTTPTKYIELERGSNDLAVDILCELVDSEKNPKKVLGVLGARLDGIQTKYSDRIHALQDKIEDLEAKGNGTAVERNRLKHLKTTYEENLKKIENLVQKPKTPLQTVYRQVLENYAKEQRLISMFQHSSTKMLNYANTSLTEAFIDAGSAMEKHVYSVKRPTDKQLWKLNEGQLHVDTHEQPSLRQSDALLAACLIRDGNDFKEMKEISSTVQGQFEEFKKQIAEANVAAKLAINVAKKAGRKASKLATVAPAAQEDMEHQNKLRQPLLANAALVEAKSESKSLTDTKLPPESPLPIYKPKDILSAIGMGAAEFGKYFEGEMAAKHPNMTFGFFLLVSTTFGAAGLKSLNIAPDVMNSVLQKITQTLTLNGNVGITPDQLQQVITVISNEWLTLTNSASSPARALLMDAFGLPKLTYLTFDTMINGLHKQDVLTTLQASRFAATQLEGKTEKEKALETAKIVMTLTGVFVLAIASGIGAEQAGMHLTNLWGTIAKVYSSVADIPLESLTNLFIEQSIPQTMLAIVSTLITVKAAGLLIGKGYLVFQHMMDACTTNEEKAAVRVMEAMKLRMDSYKELIGNNHSLNDFFHTTEDLEYFNTQKALFLTVLEKNPDFRKKLGNDFLTLFEYPTWPRIRAAGKLLLSIPAAVLGRVAKPLAQTVAGLLALIPMGLTRIFAPRQFKSRFVQKDFLGLYSSLLKLGITLSNVIGMFVSAGKTFTIATHGFLQRLPMAMFEIPFAIASTLNYMRSYPVSGAFLGFIAKPVLSVSSIVLQIASIPVPYIVGALSVLSAVIASIFVATVSFVIALRKDRDAAPNVFGVLKDIVTKPFEFVNDSRRTMVRTLANSVLAINTRFEEVNDYSGSIDNARITALVAISDTFNWVKVKLGKGLYAIRNLRRGVESELQVVKGPGSSGFMLGELELELELQDRAKVVGVDADMRSPHAAAYEPVFAPATRKTTLEEVPAADVPVSTV